MPRRPTDLLDVFRTDRAAAERSAGTRTAAAAASAAAAAKGARRRFEGLFLYPRQLLLGSAVVVLLLVFTFVLGLSVGRRGSAAPTNLLTRNEARTGEGADADETRVFVLARVPYLDKTQSQPNDPKALRHSLVQFRSVPPDRLWILDERASESWVVVLGPFADRRKATEFLAEHLLTRSKLGGVYPFEKADFRSLPLSGLPAERLPVR